ncbi:cell wall-binding repeat-containing protein [Euzebya sp.]|uniref:cell wall-binding repeat-containing protein n=1 Tax=Euzebya sp. TaxID=1971409 RepID=UPI003512F639
MSLPSRPAARVPLPLLAVLSAVLLAVLALPALAQDGAPGDPSDPGGEPVTPGSVVTGRLAGDSRIETAVAISQRAFPDGAATAYLANADVTVDAVAGGSLTDGPVLLVPACDLPQVVADELARLAPGEVLALGGTVAVCDDVLAAAGEAAATGGGDPGDGDQPDHLISATAELVDASGDVPFTVSATDPGIAYEGGTSTHLVQATGTDGTIVLDDPRFSGVLRDGDGQLVVTGRGCGPSTEPDGEPTIACTDDFAYVEVEEGETTDFEVTLHTADESVGDAPLLDGTYTLDQPVRWEADATDPTSGDPTAEASAFDDGSATIRVTYTVTSPDGPDVPEEPGTEVVEWATPDGTFRTTGHHDVDLARIEEGIAAGEHIGIPNGVIHRGDGGVNVGHDWHLTDVEIVDVTIEVCDGTAAYVDAHLEDFLEIGRYCPWGAIPIAIER